ncbi:MAG: hypothetical protein ACD_46C00502G0009, partial [uncultured bacterium]
MERFVSKDEQIKKINILRSCFEGFATQ